MDKRLEPTFHKEAVQMAINRRRGAQLHQSSGKRKLKPLWDTTPPLLRVAIIKKMENAKCWQVTELSHTFGQYNYVKQL